MYSFFPNDLNVITSGFFLTHYFASFHLAKGVRSNSKCGWKHIVLSKCNLITMLFTSFGKETSILWSYGYQRNKKPF